MVAERGCTQASPVFTCHRPVEWPGSRLLTLVGL